MNPERPTKFEHLSLEARAGRCGLRWLREGVEGGTVREGRHTFDLS